MKRKDRFFIYRFTNDTKIYLGENGRWVAREDRASLIPSLDDAKHIAAMYLGAFNQVHIGKVRVYMDPCWETLTVSERHDSTLIYSTGLDSSSKTHNSV